MAVLEQALKVVLQAFAWVTTSAASDFAFKALAEVANLVMKLVGSIA